MKKRRGGGFRVKERDESKESKREDSERRERERTELFEKLSFSLS